MTAPPATHAWVTSLRAATFTRCDTGSYTGWLSRPPRSSAIMSACLRAAERRHAQHRDGGQRRGVAGGHLGEQARKTHLAEHVEPIVRRGAVGAERDVDAAREQRNHGRDSARELHVRRGAMHDVAAV